MSKKFIILLFGLTWSLQSFGQVERQAIENIWKGKWEKAFYQLDRAANKDTIRVSLAYAWAIYFGSTENPDYSLDSASRYIRASVALYGQTTEKQRERLRRFPLDSVILNAERNRIDSAALAITRADGSALAYQRFLDIHPGSIFESVVIDARDERAFRDAVEANTYEAFLEYLNHYPQSLRAADAKANYERLLYQHYTRTGDLAGYQRFLHDYPGTSYEKEAHRNIFEIQTADGSTSAYLAYLTDQTPYSRRASDILFHLDEKALAHLTASPWRDSLRASIIHPAYLTPYLENGMYGFMDQEGQTVLKPVNSVISDDYLCGNITDNIIRFDSALVALNGKAVYSGKVAEWEDLGLGFLLVSDGKCQRVIHKSGWQVTRRCVDDAKVVAHRFIAIQLNDKWQLMTLSGRPLMKQEWDAITSVNQFVVVESQGQKSVATPAMLGACVAAPQSKDPFVRIDRISRWSSEIALITLGEKKILVNLKSDTLATNVGGTLLPARFGVVIIENDTSSHTVNWNRESSETFRSISVSDSQAIVQTSTGWRMFDPTLRKYGSAAFDSLWWTGSFAIGTRRDSACVFFPGGQQLKLKGKLQVTAIHGPDSTAYLLVNTITAKPGRLYSQNGKLLMQVPFERIQALGMGYFRVFKSGKAGLVASDGKVVVPPMMDAIGAITNNTIALLKDGKFGLFHCLTRKSIQPQFPTNLTPYGKQYIVAQRNGLVGLYQWDNKPASKFDYDEIRYWNDTAAFVKRDAKWSLVSLRSNRAVIEQIRGIRFIRSGSDNQIAIVNAGDSFGVLHSRKGTIIPLTFTDIVNVGSAEVPLFFTEKHIPEASLYVVIYYDREGKFLRKDSYTSEDYERIYCPNN